MLIWSPVVDWEQVPIGAYISVSRERDDKPSVFWYSPDLIQCIYTGMNLSDDGTLLVISYDCTEESSVSHDEYSMDTEFPRAFLYATELPDYDPDQEPEDDCL